MKNKYFFRSLIIIVVLILLSGCGKTETEKKLMDIEVDSDTGPKDEEPISESIIREDEEKLVEVVIENGEAIISFDFERWEELYQLKEEAPTYVEIDAMSEGPFPIIVESGKVVDAFVAFVDGATVYLPEQANTLPCPVVALLMDDNSLEWFEADPYYTMYIKGIGGDYGDYIGFESLGKLPHRDDFLSFSYESDNEGYGNKTIFVTSATGEKYDFRYLIYESRLFYGTWVCPLPSPPDNQFGFLNFMEDGGVEWEMGGGIYVGSGYELGQAYEIWDGIYEYIKTNDREYPIGTLVFDMYGWWIYEGGDIGYEDRMQGSYRTYFEHMDDLNLVYNDGVPLYQFEKEYDEYNFWCYDM